jgi:hypothetical protein
LGAKFAKSARKNEESLIKTSVAEPGCLSRIPKQQQKRGMKKKLVVIPIVVAINFTKLKLFYF